MIYGIILNAPSSSPLDTVNAIRKGNDVMGFYTAQLPQCTEFDLVEILDAENAPLKGKKFGGLISIR